MNDYKFGNFICYLRTEKGLSQSQLGNMIGVSNKAVSKWEMGVSKPRPAMLVTLATLFDVTVEELLAGEKNIKIENIERAELKDHTINLWAGEYLKKKRNGRNAVITSVLLPFILFVWVGVIVGFNLLADILGPIGTVVLLFAEAIDIALIFVFYGSARKLKHILYTVYPEQDKEITSIISPKREKIQMLKWEKICSILSCVSLIVFYLIRIVILSIVEKSNQLHILNIMASIPIFIACILQLIVVIHYYIRVHKISKRK